mmetsp:Transcript_32602/g.55719  ORF Transcript_32602/g.55719 Transcript_32602/m.55719 type:complete len:285 (-) Transcript_32602:2219-3073(-)
MQVLQCIRRSFALSNQLAHLAIKDLVDATHWWHHDHFGGGGVRSVLSFNIDEIGTHPATRLAVLIPAAGSGIGFAVLPVEIHLLHQQGQIHLPLTEGFIIICRIGASGFISVHGQGLGKGCNAVLKPHNASSNVVIGLDLWRLTARQRIHQLVIDRHQVNQRIHRRADIAHNLLSVVFVAQEFVHAYLVGEEAVIEVPVVGARQQQHGVDIRSRSGGNMRLHRFCRTRSRRMCMTMTCIVGTTNNLNVDNTSGARIVRICIRFVTLCDESKVTERRKQLRMLTL